MSVHAVVLIQCAIDAIPEAAQKINTVLAELADHALTKSHARHLSAEKCRSIGLKVTRLEDAQQYQELVLSVHHACILTLGATPAFKIIENQSGVAFIQISQTLIVQPGATPPEPRRAWRRPHRRRPQLAERVGDCALDDLRIEQGVGELGEHGRVGLEQRGQQRGEGLVRRGLQRDDNKIDRSDFLRPRVRRNVRQMPRRVFLAQSGCSEEDLVVLMKMTLENLLAEGQLNHADFLTRVDILGALGRTVLISKFAEYYRLAGYLFRYTNKNIGLVMGVPSLIEIFDEKYYLNLEGGILEALGRMFKGGLRLYVYPMIDETTGKIVSAKQINVAPNLRSLFRYLIDNQYIEEITDYDPEYLRIYPPDTLAKLQSGDSSWERMVPPEVVRIIKEREFFGYRRPIAA